MQSRNDHIEDLVRQAAELNPISAKGADWDSVYNRLVNNNEESSKVEAKSKRYLFLLLFLLSSLLCNEFYYIVYNDHVKNNLKSISNESSLREKNNAGLQETINDIHTAFRNVRTLKEYNSPVYLKDLFTTKSEQGEKSVISNATSTNTENIFSEASDNIAKESITSASPENLLINNEEEKINENLKPEDQKIPVKTEPAQQKRFYAAFLLGPDISTVNFGEIKAAGHSIGISAGIKLSNRFSIETGAFLNQKKYVAEGEYFKAEKLYLPDHSKLLNVSGYCNMIEIPLNIRYNFATNNNYNLFALAGASSYLVQKENYDYQYSRYNNLYSSNKSYSQASNELFNIINLGAGFEKRVGKTTALRIEPYVKLPVKGMGIGDMRLTSAGILVGVRYPF
jgi:hypothetical protein